jgi:hypothetical protein
MRFNLRPLGVRQHIAFHPQLESSVDAPADASGKSDWHVVGCCHLSGLLCSNLAAGLYGSSRVGSTSHERARSTLIQPGFSDPVSPTVVPYPPSTAYVFRRPLVDRPAYAAAATGAL